MQLAKLDKSKLVGPVKLLEMLFADPDDRPCPRTLCNWTKARKVSSYKIGRGRWYDPEEVRAELEKKNKIRAL